MEMQMETERHPFRFMLRFLIFVGILYAAGRFLAQKKQEFEGITESEARAKLETKLTPRVGEDKAVEVAEQVVRVLLERGIIKSETAEETVDADTAEDTVDLTEEDEEDEEELAEAVDAATKD